MSSLSSREFLTYILQIGVKTFPFKIESDVSAVLVRNRRAKVVNQSFSVEMLGCVGHWGGQR